MRPAQAAIEYLFMIALALTMVLIAIRLMKQSAQQASRNIDSANREIIETLQNMTSGG
ncbi:class III signal peptide [Thermococcus henrietii]|uniref:class III signal peptide n=1 Tax=Thermococcus henrietii TaxID=2016361 RepID=UPI000C06F42B|nr:class III signal peptide [Thermococcus henrietii]